MSRRISYRSDVRTWGYLGALCMQTEWTWRHVYLPFMHRRYVVCLAIAQRLCRSEHHSRFTQHKCLCERVRDRLDYIPF